jgi:hypothetical protein
VRCAREKTWQGLDAADQKELADAVAAGIAVDTK